MSDMVYRVNLTVKYIIISTIMTVLISSTATSAAFAGGHRLDSSDGGTAKDAQCWVDGYDAGFAQKYDKGRANECEDIPGDQYNASWQYGCVDSGLTEAGCNDMKDNPQNIENHEAPTRREQMSLL
jgi:hypothetical protein